MSGFQKGNTKTAFKCQKCYDYLTFHQRSNAMEFFTALFHFLEFIFPKLHETTPKKRVEALGSQHTHNECI